MSARGILVLVVAMGAAAAATYYVVKNPEVGEQLSRSLNLESKPARTSSSGTATAQPAASGGETVAQPRADGSIREASCKFRDANEASGRVVGGGNAHIQDWPGFVALRTARKTDAGKPEYFYFCGGTAINANWVVTAAHCFWDDNGNHRIAKEASGWQQRRNHSQIPQGSQLEVMVGRESLTADAADTTLPVADVILHEKYDGNPVNGNDIALVKLAAPYVGKTMKLSAALEADPSDDNGTNMYVAGFGRTSISQRKLVEEVTPRGRSHRAFSHRLRENYIPLFDKDCGKAVTGKITGDQICAGFVNEEDQDSCSGDSGGPLARLGRDECPILVGVVSWGNSCGQKSNPGVYTRVSAFYPWIKKATRDAQVAAVSKAGDTAPLDPVIQAVAAMQSRSVGPAGDGGRVIVETEPPGAVKIGDFKKVKVTAKGMSGYVVVMDVDSAGGLYYLVPNDDHDFDPPFIQEGQSLWFGDGANGTRRFQAGCPAGEGRVMAIVSPDKSLWRRMKDTLKTRDPGGASRGLNLEKKGDASLLDLARKTQKEAVAIGSVAYSIAEDPSCQ